MMKEYESAVERWQQKQIHTAAELDAAMSAKSIALAYHSGRIENEHVTYHDTREIFEHDRVNGYTGDLRTLFEIRNAKAAYELLLTAFGEGRRLDGEFIKALQRALTENTYDERRWSLGERPGEYKRHDYAVGRAEVGAAAEDVSEEMNELLDELDGIPPEKALVAAAYFHAKFENIHPFSDGNGRTGRLLMNYLLLTLNHPPVIIHEEDRREYYAALEAWDTEQALGPLIAFLKAQTVKTWEK